MPSIDLIVASDSEVQRGTVLQAPESKPNGPIITGEGNFDYKCASCALRLIERVDEDQVQGVVLLCPRCGTHNRTHS